MTSFFQGFNREINGKQLKAKNTNDDAERNEIMPPIPLFTSSRCPSPLPISSPKNSRIPPPQSKAIHGFTTISSPWCAASPPSSRNVLPILHSHVRAGRMNEARKLFDEMQEKRPPVAWTILMYGYASHGPAAEALSLFRELHAGGRWPHAFDFSIILRVCASLSNCCLGRELHCFCLKSGYLEDVFVANGLVAVYASCGLLRCSEDVFWGIRQPDLASWTSMLSALIKNGFDEKALWLLEEMARDGVQFDAYVLSVGLKASSNLNCRASGVQIHCSMVKLGLNSHAFLRNSLLEFYGRLGELGMMRMNFDRMMNRDLVSWNTMISCYACSFCDEEAFMLFRSMVKEGLLCDDFTLGSILQAVTSQGSLNYGREIHGFAIRAGFGLNCHVNSALLDMYIKCSTCQLSNLCRYKLPLRLFFYFLSVGGRYDDFIISSILKFCASQKDFKTGKALHSCILKLGMSSNAFVISSLIDMYAKSGFIASSLSAFAGIDEPSLVLWSAIIAGHCFNGCFVEALKLFRKMQFSLIKANEFTYTSVVLACLAAGKLKSGKEIHCSIIRNGYESNSSVNRTLINFYTELRQLHKALPLCSSIPVNDAHWVYLTKAFAMVEDHGMVLKLFHQIQQSRAKLDHLSATYVLDSCSNSIFLSAGTQAHAYIIKRGLIPDINTSISLINMYSRCGTILDAADAFQQMPEKNASSWTSMISADVNHGRPSRALHRFRQMIGKDKHPDCETFLFVLKACQQMGLVDEAFCLFIRMVEVYKIKPSLEIYSCMAQVLSCAGMSKEAEHFVESAIPLKSNVLDWRENFSSTCQK